MIMISLYEKITMADTHLPQPVIFPHKDASKEIRMMQPEQREQDGAEENWVSQGVSLVIITYIAYTDAFHAINDSRFLPMQIGRCSRAHELPLGFHCSSKES